MHERHRRRLRLLARVEVETEIADVGPAARVHDHVVGVEGEHGREVRVQRETAVRLAAQQLALPNRHHEETPVGQPAEARRLVVEGQHRLVPTVSVERQHATGMHVGDPQLAVVPARILGEAQAGEQQARSAHGFFSAGTRW